MFLIRMAMTALLMLSVAAVRADNLVVGGATLSQGTTYNYLGVIDPFAGGEIGDGWFASYFVSYLTYDYEKLIGATLEDISATAPGIDAGVGYAWSDTDYWLNLSASAGYRNFSLDPDIASESPRGGQEALTVQLQWDRQLGGSANFNLLSSYSLGPDTSFTRLRLARGDYSGWRLGPEYVYQKGENYENQQFGLVLYRPRENWSWEYGVGQSRNQDGESGAYLTLGFVKPF